MLVWRSSQKENGTVQIVLCWKIVGKEDDAGKLFLGTLLFAFAIPYYEIELFFSFFFTGSVYIQLYFLYFIYLCNNSICFWPCLVCHSSIISFKRTYAGSSLFLFYFLRERERERESFQMVQSLRCILRSYRSMMTQALWVNFSSFCFLVIWM